jgi:hypothetical protein
VDPLRAPVVARDVDDVKVALEELESVGFDQRVDHERAPGLPLAIQAMAAVNDHRLAHEAIPHASARAASFVPRHPSDDLTSRRPCAL